MENKFPFKSILVVCSVNTARSRIAEGFLKDYFKKHDYEIKIKSGGISSHARDGMLISMDARLVMEEIGINLSKSALSVDLKKHPDIINDADLILTLTKKHKEELNNFFTLDSKKILTIKEFAGEQGDIEDPSMKEIEGFRKARNDIIDSLLKGLKKYSLK